MVQNPTFVSPALIVVTSNVNISNATMGAYDEGPLGDRVIEINFSKVPARPQAGFKDYLERETSALIN
jgi:hypothetical protein